MKKYLLKNPLSQEYYHDNGNWFTLEELNDYGEQMHRVYFKDLYIDKLEDAATMAKAMALPNRPTIIETVYI